MNIKDKNLYYIGGVVRDEILGKPSFDTDLTYRGNAIDFAKTIPDIEILQINEPFGTVRIKSGGKEFDIASTRTETYPRKGHLPEVDKIGCSLKEDVMRRDFTINALAKSTLTGEIIDYTNGLEDIKNKTLRILYDTSFIDDPTRIVRRLKFAVRFGFDSDEHTRKLQNDYLDNINYDMSYKRLKKELVETFNLNKREAFEKFIKQRIYKLVAPVDFTLPEYDFENLIKMNLSNISQSNIWIIYVGLLPDISNLPLTKAENKIIEEFKKLKSTIFNNDFEICKAFNAAPIESVIMYSTVNHKTAEKYLTKLKNIKLTLNGKDLQNLGIAPNAKYRECFDYILKTKIPNPKMTKADELKLAKEFFNLS